MEHLPQLVYDLALILIIAGVTTLLFKRLKQPLILGYILAGFLTGPHMKWLPTVHDTVSIETWSSIGVIFIMFTLGLEFSFKKIIKMGMSPIIAAVSVIFFMISIGSIVGHFFGWSSMNSLFLGGMLAMSSTTIIYKAIDELGLRQHKFSGVVLGVLILEDILGILLMVILSALAVSNQFEGTQLIGSFLKLGFFLVLWFVVGIYLVPLFLRRNSKWISRETLLIVSVGLCFLLVVLATKAGYSSAFGAFMMGSILAETLEAENIERVVAPVKDLFGAIFFVSVGMLVDPAILVEYWLPIVAIVLAILLGQMFFGTFSFLLSGQSLKVSMQCGFSLTQIGEFSFILAGLGVSLGVTGEFLYPVVVAVSIITTFTTPYMMKLSEPAYCFVERHLPQRITRRLQRADSEGGNRTTPTGGWQRMIRMQLTIVGIYGVLTIAAIGMSFATLLPLSRGIFGHWIGNAVCGVVTYVIISLFLRPIIMKKMHSPEVLFWRKQHKWLQLGAFGLTIMIRFILSAFAVYYILNFLSPYRWYWHVLVAVLLTLFFCIDRIRCRRTTSGRCRRVLRNPFALWVKYMSIRIERTFTSNLRSREFRAAQSRPRYANTLRRHDIHLAQLQLPEGSAWGGKTLQQLGFGHKDGVMIAAVIRGDGRLNIPDGSTMLFPCDKIEVLGDDESLANLSKRMQTEVTTLADHHKQHALDIAHFTVTPDSPLANVTLSESGIRDEFNCMVVGFDTPDENENAVDMPTANRTIVPNDTIWVVGERKDITRLIRFNKRNEPSSSAHQSDNK